VQSVLGASSAFSGSTHGRARRARALFLAIAGSAIVAISAATALPPRVQSAAPAPAVARNAGSIRYLGAAAEAAPKQANPAANDTNAQRFGGRVGQDLTQSLERAGVPERAGREYVAVLSRAVRLANGLSVDDRFDLIIERKRDGSLGQLLYAGLDRVARADVELLKWTDGKRNIWVDADAGYGGGSSAMRMPVSGRVTSGFGERFHPILGYTRMHEGVDLGAPSGAPIVAAADGRVIAAGWRGGYGRQVAIVHGGGLETTYSHMSRIVAEPGSLVHQGQLIGYVGASGLATGPHLHYEVLKNGRPVNPLSVKLAGPSQLDEEHLRALHDRLRQLLVNAG